MIGRFGWLAGWLVGWLAAYLCGGPASMKIVQILCLELGRAAVQLLRKIDTHQLLRFQLVYFYSYLVWMFILITSMMISALITSMILSLRYGRFHLITIIAMKVTLISVLSLPSS
jgi:hypothetical protein